MKALNKQARLFSSARISEIANGANLIMDEKEWLANTAIYLANELKTATKAFQSTGFSLLEAEEKLEAAECRIAELEAKIETADKLQDSAFRHGLQHGFSCGQTNDQAGFEQCLKSYSSRGKDNG